MYRNSDIIVYVSVIESDEIKSAIEVAETEYACATERVSQCNQIVRKIETKVAEYSNKLDAVYREFRKTEGCYKRSKLPGTRAKLYRKMTYLTSEREYLESIVRDLNRLFDAAYNHCYVRELSRQREAENAMTEARIAAGLKFSVYAIIEHGGKRIAERANVSTIAEAVAFIYRNADKLVSWHIFTEYVEGLTRRKTIAEGETLDADVFSELIKNHGTSAVDAEIVTSHETSTPRHVDLKTEFRQIVLRSIHNFTLGNYLDSIVELRTFCRKIKNQGGELYHTAQSELDEWIQIARSEGIEIADIPTEDTIVVVEQICLDFDSELADDTNFLNCRTIIDECADLQAGVATIDDFKHDDVPDLCNDETFQPNDFLRKGRGLSRNINKRQIETVILNNFGCSRRVPKMTGYPIRAEAILQQRLNFP